MKGRTRLLSLGLAVSMLVGFIPQTAFADSMDFGGRSQMKWSDAPTGGWGTIQLESGKILKKGEGGDLASISSSKSVFNQFVYYRGKDYYTGTSDGATFAYDTWKSDYGAKIADGKYLYAVYNKDNDKNDYKVDFGASFSSDLQQLIKKGDLEVAIVAEAKNYKGSTNKQRGIAQLRFYKSGASAIQHEITTDTGDYDGTRTVSAGWYKPSSDINRAIMNLRSERNKFTRKFNKSYVSKVRVFLRDNGAPGIKSCRISGGDFTSRKNVNGKDVYTAKVGSKIEYEVQFDEKIKVNDTSKLKLLLKNNTEAYSSNANFTADFSRVSGDKIYFTYTVPDNTNNSKGYELKVTADTANLLNAKNNVTDIAGNALENDSVAFTKRSSGTVHTVDDTKTRFTKDTFSEESKKPYSATSKLDSKYVVFGSVPKNVYTGTKQSTIFSEYSTTKPVFRVVLDDEIQKACLNDSTKLKLQVYNSDGGATGKYVYAKLVCAGIVGVKTNESNGIKSDAYTELYFEYTPQRVDGYPLYKVNFAGSEQNNTLTLDDDVITYSGGKLKNISNMDVDGGNLKVNLKSYGDLPPFNKSVTIDTQSPTLAANNVGSEWSKAFKSDANIVFTDDGGLNLVDGAYVSLVHYDSRGNKKILPVEMNSRIKTEAVNLSLNGNKNKATVNLSNIKLSDSYKAEYPLYLEYKVTDLAGNVATNEGQKNIEVYLDNTPPTVNGVTTDNQKGNVTVKYDVTDTGVGKIKPLFSYTLINHSLAVETDASTEDSKQELTVTGNEGRLDHWEVEAKFSDTVGNVMKKAVSSGVFTTALRGMVLNFNDSEDSVVSDKHSVTADTSKLPTEEATFEVKYGWRRGASATVSADAKTKVTFKSAEEFAKYDFATEAIQKKYNNGNVFDGEFTLVIETVMMPEESKQVHAQTFYFDVTSPEGVITVQKDRNGINQDYDIQYDLYDDSSEYKNGAYVSERNIDFTVGNRPVMSLYIDGELAKEYPIYSYKSSQTIDFKKTFDNDEKYENATTAYTKIDFQDKFGHKSTITGSEMAIDLKDPTIDNITVDGDNILSRGEDLYVVNNLSDIKSITAFFDDNSGDLLNVSYGAKKTKKQTANYEVTVDGIVDSDFQYRYKDYGRFDYTFDVTDMGGNSASRTVSFIVDYTSPRMYYRDLSPITTKTNAESVDFTIDYNVDDYETLDDIKFDVTGPAEIADSSELGKVTLKIKDNGTVKLAIRDAMGKVEETTFEVNCFDRVKPEIVCNTVEQKPESGKAKYGTITMTASDNETLTVLGVAIVTGEPKDNDFFTDTAETRVVSASDDGTGEVYAEEGYFGENGDAFAKLVTINPQGATGNVTAGYKLSYGAIPDGKYGVWARVSDEVGNVTTVKLTEIETTSETASAVTEYTPDGERSTGGEVTAKVTTDIRTRLLYGSSDDNIEAMKAHAAEARANGYTYTYGGETKTLTFSEACEKYRDIAKKYLADDGNLTDEERYLVRYEPTYSSYERYGGYLNSDQYIDPEGDLADYLMSRCLYGTDYIYPETGYMPYLDVDTTRGTEVDITNITDSYYSEVLSPLSQSGIIDEIYKDDTSENPDPEVSPIPKSEEIAYRVDLDSYPEKFDNYSAPAIDKESLTPSDCDDNEYFDNPFHYKSTVTLDELYEVFGEDFDLSLVTEVDGAYENPFDPEEYSFTRADIDENLLEYMGEYIEDRTKYYDNPFVSDDDWRQPMTYADIKAVLAAVPKLQSVREQTAERAADKYVRSYVSMYGNIFALEHLMTFGDNVNRSYSLVDEAGRITQLGININWIDHSKPYVPKDGIHFYVNEQEFEGKYTNADSGVLDVALPDDGIFAEYRLANLPEGAVGIDEEVTDIGTLYRGFTLEVTENGTVEFDVVNPTGTDTSPSPQAYVVKCFDRTAPTYELVYSPQKPSNGADVNRDVTVTLTEIEDDFSGRDGITVSENSYTFTKNGRHTFTLSDEAGNETTIPVEVDYIDKSATKLDVKFKSGETELDNDTCFTVTSNEDDYRNVSYEYAYNGAYLKDDVTAYVYYRGELVQTVNIGDDGEYVYTHNRTNGSKGTVKISGVKFDKMPPEAEVNYTYIDATSTAKDAVRADITLTDNISRNITLVSAAGSDDGGNVLTAGDVKTNADGTRSVTFSNNGNATLVFADESGNTTEVALSVTNLDRTAPRAFISYSSDTPTNSDVIATISLSKLADYCIYGDNNTLLKPYSGAFSTYITHTFEDNGMKVFKFRDTAGNETEGLLATVNNIDKVKPELSATVEYNKMVTDSGTLEYYPGAATITLNAESAGDVLDGGEGDTIFLQNAVQSKYHSVLSNGRYAFRYMDGAGNFDVLYVDVDGIDTAAPTATTTGNPTSWTNVPPEITITPNQKASGIKTYIYQNGAKQAKTTLTPTENGTYTFTVTDEIGNSSTHKVEVKFVDTVAPQIEISDNNVYGGNRDIYIKVGEFDKTAFEAMTVSDNESGVVSQTPTIEYGEFDQNVPGEYSVYVTGKDIAGNETVLTRKVLVMGPDDVYAAINDQLIIPGTQANYMLGEELKLSFVNAETAGNKVAYAFEKGFYNAAQMKGKNFKALANPTDEITLDVKSTGMYTLFLQTENRNIMVMYVFISG